MNIQTIQTPDAPQALGPYSQAFRTGDYIFASCQIPIDPVTGEMVRGDIHDQTRQVMKNLQHLLAAAGSRLDDVVKSTVYLTDLADTPAVNTVYAQWFGDHRPPRTCLQVGALPKGARIGIEVIARAVVRPPHPD